MDWSVEIGSTDIDEVGAALTDKAAETNTAGDSEAASAAIVNSTTAVEGLVADWPKGHVSVSMHGHSNDDNTPVEGQPNDFVELRVNQVDMVEEEEAAPKATERREPEPNKPQTADSGHSAA